VPATFVLVIEKKKKEPTPTTIYASAPSAFALFQYKPIIVGKEMPLPNRQKQTDLSIL